MLLELRFRQFLSTYSICDNFEIFFNLGEESEYFEIYYLLLFGFKFSPLVLWIL